MINKHKKFLTAAVFCAIASTGFVLTASAEETMTHDLDEVVVEADKDARQLCKNQRQYRHFRRKKRPGRAFQQYEHHSKNH